jgi:hypothetical protein
MSHDIDLIASSYHEQYSRNPDDDASHARLTRALSICGLRRQERHSDSIRHNESTTTTI